MTRRSQSQPGSATLFSLLALFPILGLLLPSCLGEETILTRVGLSCEDSSDCQPPLICLMDFPDGYCSEACDDDSPCEPGVCAKNVCLSSCSSSLDCRSGYSCVHVSHQKGCAPSGRGFSELGDNCTLNTDCSEDLTCQSFTAGSYQCTKSCTSLLSCGTSAVCVSGLCNRTCSDSSECDDYQECTSTSSGYVCRVPPPRSGVGGPCQVNEDCQEGFSCLTDAPGGYCTRECSNSEQCGSGICHDGYCYSSCKPAPGVLDILFVIDDSIGMSVFQDMFIQGASGFFDAMARRK